MAKQNIMGRLLDAGDIGSAAKRLGVTDAHLRAVMEVEASGSGFLEGSGDPPLPKILFEAHIFSRETGGRFDASHPGISSAKWNRALYAAGVREHDRLREAAGLDFDAAYKSASWGLFQIMGFNHEAAGYDQLHDFIGVQYVSEGLQLQCGVNFILANGLDKFLRQGDWRGFAKGYNGPEYEKNNYHEKLASAFSRFVSGAAGAGGGTKELQHALNAAGFNLAEDGVMGPRTEAAIREFQRRKGLTVDGIAGPQTRRALGL